MGLSGSEEAVRGRECLHTTNFPRSTSSSPNLGSHIELTSSACQSITQSFLTAVRHQASVATAIRAASHRVLPSPHALQLTGATKAYARQLYSLFLSLTDLTNTHTCCSTPHPGAHGYPWSSACALLATYSRTISSSREAKTKDDQILRFPRIAKADPPQCPIKHPHPPYILAAIATNKTTSIE